MQFDLVVALWGEMFPILFDKICLPSLCASGNLRALSEIGRTTLWVYAPADEPLQFDLDGWRERLPSSVAVELVPVPGIATSRYVADSYAALSTCHRLAVERAAARAAVLVFLPGDGVWTEGSLGAMANHIVAGKRAVLCTGVRVAAERYLDTYVDRFLDIETWTATCPPRALVESILPHLHQLTLSTIIDNPLFTSWPSLLTWPVVHRDSPGLLLRAFHLHPAFVHPRRYGDFVGTIDHGLISAAVANLDEVYVVTDSDEALQINLDTEKHRLDLIGSEPAQIDRIREWARINTTAMHRRFCRDYVFKLHAGALDSSWAAVSRRSEAFVAEVLDGLD